MKKTKAFIRSKACLKKQSVWKSRQVSSEWVTHHKGGLGCVYRGIFWVVSGQSPLQVVLVWAWRGFPGGARGKEPVCQCRRRETWDVGLIPGSGRSAGEGHGNPLQPGDSPWTEEPGGLQSMGLHSRGDLAGRWAWISQSRWTPVSPSFCPSPGLRAFSVRVSGNPQECTQSGSTAAKSLQSAGRRPGQPLRRAWISPTSMSELVDPGLWVKLHELAYQSFCWLLAIITVFLGCGIPGRNVRWGLWHSGKNRQRRR